MIKLHQLDASLRKRIEDQIKNEDHTNRKVPDPIAERHEAPALDTANAGKEQGMGRVRVCFRGYRVRPLDPDNFAGSVKDCLDYLRRCGLIEGDEPWRITLETDQVKVKTFKEEMTVFEIHYP